MYTVMVTGGIGSGKSKLVELLCERGAVSIDLDEINRGLITSNAMLISELAARFGEEILDEDGAVIPARLARLAFVDEQSSMSSACLGPMRRFLLSRCRCSPRPLNSPSSPMR